MEEGSVVHQQHAEVRGLNPLKQGPPSRDRVSAAIALVRARQAARSRNGRSNENSPKSSPVAKKDCTVTFASPVVTEMTVSKKSPKGKDQNSTGALLERSRLSPRSRKNPLPPSNKSNLSPRLSNTNLTVAPLKEKVVMSDIDTNHKTTCIPDETGKDSNILRIVSTYEGGIHDTISPSQTRSPLSPKSSNRHFFPPDNEIQDIDHPEGDLIPSPKSNKASDQVDNKEKQHIHPLNVTTLNSPKSPTQSRSSPLSPKSRFRFLRIGKEAMNSSCQKDSTSKSQHNVILASPEARTESSEESSLLATDQLNNQENSPIADHLLGESRQIDSSSRANFNVEKSSQMCLHISNSSSEVIHDKCDSKDSEETSVDSQILKDVGTFIDAMHNKQFSSSTQEISYHPLTTTSNQELHHLSRFTSVGSSDSESGPVVPPATLADIGAYIDAVVKHKEFQSRSMSSDEGDEIPDETKIEIGAFIDALHHKCREVREPNEITYVSSSDDSLLLNEGRILENNSHLENEVHIKDLRLEDEVLQLLDEVLGDSEVSPVSKANASQDTNPLIDGSSPVIEMAGEGFIRSTESLHIHTDLEISSDMNNHVSFSNMNEITSLDNDDERLISPMIHSLEESAPETQTLRVNTATQNGLDNKELDQLGAVNVVALPTNISEVSTTSESVEFEVQYTPLDTSVNLVSIEGNPIVRKLLAALPAVEHLNDANYMTDSANDSRKAHNSLQHYNEVSVGTDSSTLQNLNHSKDEFSSKTSEIFFSSDGNNGNKNEMGTIEELVNTTTSLISDEVQNLNCFKDVMSTKTHEMVENESGTIEKLVHTALSLKLINRIDDTSDVFGEPEVEKISENERKGPELYTNITVSRGLGEEPYGGQSNLHDLDMHSLTAGENFGGSLTSMPHNQYVSSGWNLTDFFDDDTELENNNMQAQSVPTKNIQVSNRDTKVNDAETEFPSFQFDSMKVQRESLAAPNYHDHGLVESHIEADATHSVETLEGLISPMQRNGNTTNLDSNHDVCILDHDHVTGDDLADASFEVDASDLIDTFLAGSVAHNTTVVVPNLNFFQYQIYQNDKLGMMSVDDLKRCLNTKIGEPFSHASSEQILGDTKDGAQAVRDFISRMSPVLSCDMEPLVKEAHFRSEAARIGLSKESTEAILTHVMGLNTGTSDLCTADSFELDQILDDERFKCIEELDQSENIAAFLSRMKALEAGGHFSEMRCEDIAADEAVEVDFELGFINRTLKDGVNDEGPWWNEDSAMQKFNLGSDSEKAIKTELKLQHPGSPQKSGLPRVPTQKKAADIEVLKLQNHKAQLSSKQNLEMANSYILHSLSLEELPQSLSIPKAPSLMEEIERQFEEKERKLILSNNTKQSKWISPWEKRWILQGSVRRVRESSNVVGKFQSSRAPRLDVFASVSKLSQWTNCPDRCVRRVPVSQHWRMAYKERTRNHSGYADIDVFSLYEASIVVADNHPFDDEPWEYRNVKQRFLHEKSISLSRNWFGTLLRKRGNDRYREPVSIPKSMEMPMENLPGEGEWLQEWYTTWQQRLVDSKAGNSQPDDESESDSYDSDDSETCNTYTVYTEGDDTTRFDDETATYSRSVYTVSGSVFTSKRSQYSKFSRRSSRGDGAYEDSWDDPPECGTLQNVKQRIGERHSLVHYQHLSCLSQSRWRKRYFPRGTFPYK